MYIYSKEIRRLAITSNNAPVVKQLRVPASNLQPQNNTKPNYYYIGTRLEQILHARLRMQCSFLNHHLFRKDIVNSPFCQCGATETTAHFLLHCPRHNATRLRYIHTINLPINLNTDNYCLALQT